MEKFFSCEGVSPVRTASGLVQGYLYDGVYTFKGIPYAKAQRFQMPVEPDPWEGVYDATTFGYICPLLMPEIPAHDLMAPHRYWPHSEHCLNLNVWTRSISPEAKRPVVVWFHGGGYVAGSSIEQVAYDGDNMSRYGDVVVVTVNHRLNILGYLDMSPFGDKYRNSANAGNADLVAALKWVQKNIAAFGGDPDNVTIFGHSGGGGKVACIMQTPEADGLFHKALIMSGVAAGRGSSSSMDGRAIVSAMLDELGFSEPEAERLETVPYRQLANAYNKVSPGIESSGFYVGCAPLANEFFKGDPLEVGFTEHAKTIPLMVGTVFSEMSYKIYNKEKLTHDEILHLVREKYGEHTNRALELFREAYPGKNDVDLLALDRIMRYPSKALARLHAQSGQSATYLYNFTLEFPIQYGKPAWHSADIPYFFHTTDRVEVCGIPGVTEGLERKLFGAFMSFARTGVAATEELPWPQVTPESEYTMIFDRTCSARKDYDTQLLDFISQVLPPTSLAEIFADAMGSDQTLSN